MNTCFSHILISLALAQISFKPFFAKSFTFHFHLVTTNKERLILDPLTQVRAYNDGFQPWFSNRKRFSLRGSQMTTLPAIRSEEGLAAINTIMNSRVRYLWLPALQYCKFKNSLFFFSKKVLQFSLI